MSYSQPIDLSSLLKTGGLGQYNAAASQDLKSAIGIGGGKSAGDYSGGPSLSYSSGSSPYNTAGSNVQLSSVPGSAFSPIKPAAVTNGSGDRGKALPRARLPPPSRIPSSAVEMPGAGQDSGLASLDVQFGGLDLQFGAGNHRLSPSPLTSPLLFRLRRRRGGRLWAGLQRRPGSVRSGEGEPRRAGEQVRPQYYVLRSVGGWW